MNETTLALRRAFDQSFARVPSAAEAGTESLLMIRAGEEFCALRMSEIAGLVRDHKIVVVPSPIPELIGIAGLRAGLVPVYNLAALLGHTSTLAPPRWLALCAGAKPIAFAFTELQGYRQIPKTQFYSEATRANEMVRADDGARIVISLSTLIANIETVCGKVRGSKEQ